MGESIPPTNLEKTLLNEGFLESEQPKSHDGPLYRVENHFGQLQIKQSECPKEREALVFKGKKIKFTGSNHGEFGGELIAQFANGKKRTLIKEPIVAILPSAIHTKLWVFTGFAHLGFSNGNVYTIENFDTQPTVKHITLLPDAPRKVFVSNEKNQSQADFFYILGFRSLMLLIGEDMLSIEAINDWVGGNYTVFQKENEFLFGTCGAFIYLRTIEIGGLAPRFVKFYTRQTDSEKPSSLQ
ncbi:MAG: hypothetical protein IPN42_06735 [Methylococcaceae bacterium]|nr:hypothetical protein [Methylococcaceae bacterium]